MSHYPYCYGLVVTTLACEARELGFESLWGLFGSRMPSRYIFLPFNLLSLKEHNQKHQGPINRRKNKGKKVKNLQL